MEALVDSLVIPGTLIEKLDKLSVTLLNKFLLSEKHLIITGSKGIGKTLLLKYLLNYFKGKYIGKKEFNYLSFCTYFSKSTLYGKVKSNYEDTGCITINNTFRIGKKINGRMENNISFFDKEGCEILSSFLKSQTEIVVIDEVGHLEMKSSKYIHLLEKIIDTKKLIAVKRKNKSALDSLIQERNDVFIIDLDSYFSELEV